MTPAQNREEMADGREPDRMANYTKFWDKDISRENEEHTENRIHHYKDVVNGFYDGATELYEYGWAQSFHFCRFYKGEAFLAALARHEHYLAAQMGLRPGMRVLDVGCGVGGPARAIARFVNVEIVGLNNNAFQVHRAQRYTTQAELGHSVTFECGDFMRLEARFGKNSFDAVYAIEATCHAPTAEGVYGEIFKVLKPGGIFGLYEWCMTDKWDASSPAHVELQHAIELGNGIPEMRTIAATRGALRTVGFEVQHAEDLAARKDTVPWYYPLEGDLGKAQTLWDYLTVVRISPMGRFFTAKAVWVMEVLRMVPRGTYDVGEALRVAALSLVRGGQVKIFTPMYLVISRKPEAK